MDFHEMKEIIDVMSENDTGRIGFTMASTLYKMFNVDNVNAELTMNKDAQLEVKVGNSVYVFSLIGTKNGSGEITPSAPLSGIGYPGQD